VIENYRTQWPEQQPEDRCENHSTNGNSEVFEEYVNIDHATTGTMASATA